MRGVLVLTILVLAGCKTTPVVTPPVAVVAPTGPATSAQIIALEQQIATQNDLLQRASGAVYGAKDANLHNPDGLPKDAVEAQLSEATSALPPPTTEQMLAKEQQNSRILAGELAAVKAEMGQAMDENKALRAQVVAKADELAVLKTAAEKERAEAAKKLQAQFDDFTKKVAHANAAAAKAADDARNQVMLGQVAWLNRAAAACAGVAIVSIGLATVFGGIAGLRVVAPLAAICGIASLSCFGLAQIVGQWWFKWAILGSVGAMLGVCGWWVWAHYKDGTLKESAKAKSAKLQSALTTIIPVLDEAYDHAEDSVKAAMDKLIFSRLSAVMDKTDKATVHEVRATAITDKTATP